MNSPALQLNDVSVSLGGTTLVENVSFSVQAGEIVGIIGPNGGGKSTLLKAILGLHPFTGQIQLASPGAVGYVPQYFDFDRSFPLTVRELFRIRLGRSAFSSRNDNAARTLLRRVGADDIWTQQLGVLSGGELQRVLVALALARQPELLVLDEPSTGIDIGGEETLYNLIKKLADEQKITIVFVSHDLDVVYQYADQAVCLNKRMTCVGAPHTVLTEEVIEHTHGKLIKPFRHHRHA